MTNFEPKNFKLYIPTDIKQQTVVCVGEHKGF